MFVPAGCIAISDAIEQVAFDIDAAAMRPTMPEALSRAEQALRAIGPYSVRFDNAEGLAIINWHASAETRKRWTKDRARQRLQQALGCGFLSAVALLPDGSVVCASDRLWRTSEGSRALQTGYVVDRNFRQSHECPIFLPEERFRGWREALQDHVAAKPPRPSTGSPPVRRARYTPKGLRALFVLRVDTQPRDAPFPTEAEDLVAAQLHFEGKIPRDEFREIRREMTPATWRKSGPRRPRR